MKNTVIMLAIATTLFSCGGNNDKPKMSEAEIDAKVDSLYNAELEKIEKESMNVNKWVYSEDKDEMSDAKNYYASNTSEDIATLEYPYNGNTYLTLHVRQMNGKQDAFIVSSQGQLHTDYDDKTIEIRFDDLPSEKWSVNSSADGDSKYLFIASSNKFIEKLKKSKSVKIKVMYYDNGSYVFTYKTSGLKWNH